MNTRFMSRLDRLRESLWFVPTAAIVLAGVLAWIAPRVDSVLREADLPGWAKSLVYRGNAEVARHVLGTIASSTITVAGVVFSITIVALQMASAQFGPRLLRNFLRDQGSKVTLGAFLGTYVYCLLVAMQTHPTDSSDPIPLVSVAIATALTALSLIVFVWFVHHTATSIQAPVICANVAAEMHEVIERIYPTDIGEPPADPDDSAHRAVEARFDEPESCPVGARVSGYLQAVDGDTLIALGKQHDLVIRMRYRPGHFVLFGTAFADVLPGDKCTDEVRQAIHDACTFGSRRTPLQDPEFAFSQLVEIAMRALSPSVFDPFTANTCISFIGSGLGHLAQRSTPSAYRLDDAGRLRVIAHPATFDGTVNAAINLIRQNARNNVAVTIRLLDMIAEVAPRLRTDDQRAALRQQLQIVHDDTTQAIPADYDRGVVSERYERAMHALGSIGRDCGVPASACPVIAQ